MAMKESWSSSFTAEFYYFPTTMTDIFFYNNLFNYYLRKPENGLAYDIKFN